MAGVRKREEDVAGLLGAGSGADRQIDGRALVGLHAAADALFDNGALLFDGVLLGDGAHFEALLREELFDRGFVGIVVHPENVGNTDFFIALIGGDDQKDGLGGVRFRTLCRVGTEDRTGGRRGREFGLRLQVREPFCLKHLTGLDEGLAVDLRDLGGRPLGHDFQFDGLSLADFRARDGVLLDDLAFGRGRRGDIGDVER